MSHIEAILELKHLLSLNGIAPRTEHKSLLNINLDKRRDALSHAIKCCEIVERLPSIDTIEEAMIDTCSCMNTRAYNEKGECSICGKIRAAQAICGRIKSAQ